VTVWGRGAIANPQQLQLWAVALQLTLRLLLHPQVLRAVLRWATTIIFPVFVAYFWNSFEPVLAKAVLGSLAVLVGAAGEEVAGWRKRFAAQGCVLFSGVWPCVPMEAQAG